MNRIWLFTGSFDTDRRLACGAGSIEVTHYPGDDEDFEYSMYWRRIGDRPSPAARLVLTLEDFDVDFFDWGRFMFVSKRMRDVMALTPSQARFFEIDDSQSAPLPQSMNYQMMQPTITEDVSDPERSEYRTENQPGMPPVPPEVVRLALRPDAAPKHALFFDRFFSAELLCSETLATRLLEAGCTGLTFVDPGLYFGEGMRRLTKRGVEKTVGWDRTTGEEITQLVEAIDRGDAKAQPSRPAPARKARAARRSWKGWRKDSLWLLTQDFLTGELLGSAPDGERVMTVTHHVDHLTCVYEQLCRRIGDRPGPVAEMILKREDFEIDFFVWARLAFVSERMRKAMALPSSDVAYLKIDDAASASLPRSMKYQIMQLNIVEDVSDPARSKYRVAQDASLPPTPPDVTRLAFRPDATPTHDLFVDRFFGAEYLCTDAFAMRVLRAGCTGIKFIDPSNYLGEEVHFRTLRGVEKSAGFELDGDRVVERGELVEAVE